MFEEIIPSYVISETETCLCISSLLFLLAYRWYLVCRQANKFPVLNYETYEVINKFLNYDISPLISIFSRSNSYKYILYWYLEIYPVNSAFMELHCLFACVDYPCLSLQKNTSKHTVKYGNHFLIKNKGELIGLELHCLFL